MSGHHASGGSNAKLWILVAVLVVVIAVLAFLFISTLTGGSSGSTVAAGLTTQVSVQDANGKNVTDKVSVAGGQRRPDTVEEDAELILIDTAWTGRGTVSAPVIITVTDGSFTNEDGLAVYAYTDYEWQLVGTYLIVNHSVSFQAGGLTSFAFQVISSEPEPTPEPTPSPEPEPTPIPEEPIDYGEYDAVQEGLFLQTNAMELDGSYVIAVITGGEEQTDDGDSGVTFFDANETADGEAEKITANVLLNYSGEELRTIEAEVGRTADGRYYMIDPVVDGMLWTAVASDPVNGEDRYSLANNERFLNLDEDNENVVMDDDDVRTRWLYETVEPDDEEKEDFSTLSYVVTSAGTYYSSAMEMVADGAAQTEQAGDEPVETAQESISFTVTDDEKEALTIVIFKLSDGAEETESEIITGTIVLTGTPDALNGLDATPIPTATNTGGGLPIVPTKAPATPTAPPPTDPPEETAGTGGNTGGEAGSPGDTTTTTPPTPITEEPAS